jgi:hypothetical protein
MPVDGEAHLGRLVDRLEDLAVEAVSLDGKIRASVRGRCRVTVGFAPWSYGSYAEPDLGHQLAHLASLLWTRYRRDYTEIVDAFLEEPVHVEDDDDRRFAERLARLRVSGRSTKGRISVDSRALVRWEVAVAAGTVRALGEDEFLAELASAVDDVLADYRAQLVLLTDEIYGIGLPSWRRSKHVR